MGNIIGKRNKKSYDVSSNETSTRSISNHVSAIHSGGILGMTQLSDNEVVTCSDDKTIAIFNVDQKQIRQYLKGHTKAVNRVISDGHYIWSCSRDLCVKQWDSRTGNCERTINDAHLLNISGLAVCAEKQELCSGSRDYAVKTWDLSTGACRETFSAPRNIVTCMQYDYSGNLIYQGSEDLCVRIWDTRSSSKQPSIHITGYVYFPLCMSSCPSSGGTYLATGCKGFNGVGCEVKVWDIRNVSHVPVADMHGHEHDVNSCQFVHSNQLLSASKDGSCVIWNPQLNLGQKIAKYISPDFLQYTSMALSSSSIGSPAGTSFSLGAFNGVFSNFSLVNQNSIRCNYTTTGSSNGEIMP